MDAPNAPNPANSNAQDQFMHAVQGPTIQAQDPAVQNQTQGPANNNAQIGQNVPMQPPQQLAPVQPVPIGPVVPAPQVFYQKLDRKETWNSQVNPKRMQNHIFSVLEIGWKPTTSLMISKVDIFV